MSCVWSCMLNDAVRGAWCVWCCLMNSVYMMSGVVFAWFVFCVLASGVVWVLVCVCMCGVYVVCSGE